MPNGSQYISSAGMTSGLGTPAARGCPGSTVHITQRSPASRQRSMHAVPISSRNGFARWPEWSTTSPIPPSTRRRERTVDGVGIDRRDARVLALVDVLVPDGDAQARPRHCGYATAMASISTSAPAGSPATCTVERAGGSDVKYEP